MVTTLPELPLVLWSHKAMSLGRKKMQAAITTKGPGKYKLLVPTQTGSGRLGTFAEFFDGFVFLRLLSKWVCS